MALVKLTALVALLGGCATSAHSGAGVVPFRADVAAPSFPLAGDFAGRYRQRADSIEVEVPRPVLRARRVPAYLGPIEVQAVTVALARCGAGGRWEVESRSRPVLVRRVVAAHEVAVLPPLRVTVPARGPGVPDTRWLVFELSGRQQADTTIGGTMYTHADKPARAVALGC